MSGSAGSSRCAWRSGAPSSDLYGFGAEPVRENYERVRELCTAVGDAAELLRGTLCPLVSARLRAERDETIALAAELARSRARDWARPNAACWRIPSWCGRPSTTGASLTCAATWLRCGRSNRSGRMPPEDRLRGGSAERGHDALRHCAVVPRRSRGRAASARAGLAPARASGNPLFALRRARCRPPWSISSAATSGRGGELAEEALSLAAEQGFAFWRTLASALRGWAACAAGPRARWQRRDRAGAGRHAKRSAHASSRPISLPFWPMARLRSGALSAGLAAADAGLAVTETTLDRSLAPELWRLKGELLLAAVGGVARGGTAPPSARQDSRQRGRCLVAGRDTACCAPLSCRARRRRNRSSCARRPASPAPGTAAAASARRAPCWWRSATGSTPASPTQT